jgi:hypothetical protein
MVVDRGELVEGKVRVHRRDAKGRKGIVPGPDVDHVVLGHIDCGPGQIARGRDGIGPQKIGGKAPRFGLATLWRAGQPFGKVVGRPGAGLFKAFGGRAGGIAGNRSIVPSKPVAPEKVIATLSA